MYLDSLSRWSHIQPDDQGHGGRAAGEGPAGFLGGTAI